MLHPVFATVIVTIPFFGFATEGILDQSRKGTEQALKADRINLEAREDQKAYELEKAKQTLAAKSEEEKKKQKEKEIENIIQQSLTGTEQSLKADYITLQARKEDQAAEPEQEKQSLVAEKESRIILQYEKYNHPSMHSP